MKETHYHNKSQHYGMGHTRRRRILAIAGDLQDKRVLDVGCASGYLGQELKRQGARYVAGVDIAESVAHTARERLDEVFIFDLEKEWPPAIMSQKFDVVVMGEVLEHLFDPISVLKKIRGVLSENGGVIVTTPNFMTWTNRFRFIFGLFEYEDQGMFDFGHIRFFTYSYLKKVARNAEFTIVAEEHIVFPGKLAPILKYWPSLFAFQFVAKLEKE